MKSKKPNKATKTRRQVKDLDAKDAKKVKGGTDTGMSKSFYNWIK